MGRKAVDDAWSTPVSGVGGGADADDADDDGEDDDGDDDTAVTVDVTATERWMDAPDGDAYGWLNKPDGVRTLEFILRLGGVWGGVSVCTASA